MSTNHTSLALHAHFSKPISFTQKLATHSSSLNFDIDDELSPKKDTLQDNYASSKYLRFYSATILRKNPPVLTPKSFSISAYSIPWNDWHLPKKHKSTKNSITHYF